MKLETVVILLKGACLTYIPFGSAIAAGLPELGVTSVFGVPVKFLTLLMAATVAGAGGLLAFTSQSFGTYMKARQNGNGTILLGSGDKPAQNPPQTPTP